MGLFGNKKKSKLDDWKPGQYLRPDGDMEIIPAAVNYESVVEFLTGLSDQDYAHIGKVVKIYRKADKDVANYLGVENEPTTFINPPEPPTLADSTFTDDDGRINLLDDDTELGNFLEDEPPAKVKINKTEKPKK